MSINKNVRPWPYPFKAGLTISNDSEYMSFDFFEKLMEFLNSKNCTIFGKGLDLEISSSFFHYSDNPSSLSVFKGISTKSPKSKEINRINEYIQNGWLDTIHSFGEFDNVGGFNRDHAVRCLNHIKNINSSIPIYSNHGGIENIQNVGSDYKYHKGDEIGHQAYHTDLWNNFGIKFVWTDSMINENYYPENKNFRKTVREFKNKIFKGTCAKYFSNYDNKIIKSIKLNDGLIVLGFRRFRSTGKIAPNISSLGYQLSKIPWLDFYNKNNGIIIYQHLGILYRLNSNFIAATPDLIKAQPHVFLKPFYFLKSQADKGDLWIAGCAKFLSYLRARDNLKVTNEINGKVTLEFDNYISENKDNLSGLTIYIDPQNFKGLNYDNRDIPVYYNGPDETGKYSVTIKHSKLTDIWG